MCNDPNCGENSCDCSHTACPCIDRTKLSNPYVGCCKNIATDEPFISCNKPTIGWYNNDYGDLVTYCEEHKSSFVKD